MTWGQIAAILVLCWLAFGLAHGSQAIAENNNHEESTCVPQKTCPPVSR